GRPVDGRRAATPHPEVSRPSAASGPRRVRRARRAPGAAAHPNELPGDGPHRLSWTQARAGGRRQVARRRPTTRAPGPLARPCCRSAGRDRRNARLPAARDARARQDPDRSHRRVRCLRDRPAADRLRTARLVQLRAGGSREHLPGAPSRRSQDRRKPSVGVALYGPCKAASYTVGRSGRPPDERSPLVRLVRRLTVAIAHRLQPGRRLATIGVQAEPRTACPIGARHTTPAGKRRADPGPRRQGRADPASEPRRPARHRDPLRARRAPLPGPDRGALPPAGRRTATVGTAQGRVALHHRMSRTLLASPAPAGGVASTPTSVRRTCERAIQSPSRRWAVGSGAGVQSSAGALKYGSSRGAAASSPIVTRPTASDRRRPERLRASGRDARRSAATLGPIARALGAGPGPLLRRTMRRTALTGVCRAPAAAQRRTRAARSSGAPPTRASAFAKLTTSAKRRPGSLSRQTSMTAS